MAINDMEPRDHFALLKNDELQLGTRLTPNQYAELLLNYLVQGRFIPAKYCYMRAIERFEGDPLLKQVWTFGEQICTRNFAAALKICKEIVLIDQSLQIYIAEIWNRVLAEQLQLIARTYSSLNQAKFSKLVGLVDMEQTANLLQQCAWTVADDGFITPAYDPAGQFAKMLSSLVDARFGPNEFGAAKVAQPPSDAAPELQLSEQNLANLKSLVECSTFFDAMAINVTSSSSSSHSTTTGK